MVCYSPKIARNLCKKYWEYIKIFLEFYVFVRHKLVIPLTKKWMIHFPVMNDDESNASQFIMDHSAKIDIIKEVMMINSSKEYITGRQSVDPHYDYLVILGNPTTLFPSLTVLHMVELVSQNAASPPYEMFLRAPSSTFINDMMDPPKNASKVQDEDKEAKIEDLLDFVTEIARSDSLVKDVSRRFSKH